MTRIFLSSISRAAKHANSAFILPRSTLMPAYRSLPQLSSGSFQFSKRCYSNQPENQTKAGEATAEKTSSEKDAAEKAESSEPAESSESTKESAQQPKSEDSSEDELLSLSIEELVVKYKECEGKYLKKDKDFANLRGHYTRSIADFKNLQQTTKKEVQNAKDFALQKFCKDLIESLDNFGHALSGVNTETLESNQEMKDFYDGVKMTSDIFDKTLAKHGLIKMDPIGEKFDPNIHEAVFEFAQPDKEPGTIFHVQQIGFSLNGRVLRAPKVGIVKTEPKPKTEKAKEAENAESSEEKK